MSNLAIKVENVSKLYRLGDVGTGTLGDDLTRFWAKMRGKEDPFSKIANSNDRSQKANSDYVWSLRDIDFEIKKGDAVGIIGRNGAGKSTLLKVLSRITSPTTGRVRIDGRVASLLEVGTGFSPDLTGRQNIYMNGAILGMTRAEVSAKMDEIIDFSGVEGYIDTPVKRYSSGMYVRLAFAVAAHLDPEIMIVDEVLAVGDAEFQKKCLGKMQDVNKGEGRTVLFVSHNMGAISMLCKKGIYLANGGLVFQGDIEETVAKYMSNSSKEKNVNLLERKDRQGNGNLRFTQLSFLNPTLNSTVEEIFVNDPLVVNLSFNTNKPLDFSKLIVSVAFFDQNEVLVLAYASDEMGVDFEGAQNKKQIALTIPSFKIRSGIYDVRLIAFDRNTAPENVLDWVEHAASISVLSKDVWNTGQVARSGNFALLEGNYSI